MGVCCWASIPEPPVGCRPAYTRRLPAPAICPACPLQPQIEHPLRTESHNISSPEVLQILAESAPCVAAVICGHDHKGGYYRCEASSVLHVTLRSPLNGGDAFGLRTGALRVRFPVPTDCAGGLCDWVAA